MKILLVIIAIITAIILAIFIYVKSHPVFGGIPNEEQKKRIKASPNYADGSFKNLKPTILMDPEQGGMFGTMMEWIKGPENGKPDIVETKTFDYSEFIESTDTSFKVSWFGHSSLIINLAGKTILADPVSGGYASPVPGFNGSFKFSNPIDYVNIPNVDIVLISHDHYDHLDMPTIKSIDSNVGQYLVPLGVKSHLVRWGVAENKVKEFDWWEDYSTEEISFTAAPARHFSGRDFNRNNTLWCSWIIETDEHSIFFGGDSGYGSHFSEIGEKHGPFDLTFIECGQYNLKWPQVHALPEESVQANIDLRGKRMIPIHWSKYQLALHSWTEPIERVRKAANERGVKLLEPIIGEVIEIY